MKSIFMNVFIALSLAFLLPFPQHHLHPPASVFVSHFLPWFLKALVPWGVERSHGTEGLGRGGWRRKESANDSL